MTQSCCSYTAFVPIYWLSGVESDTVFSRASPSSNISLQMKYWDQAHSQAKEYESMALFHLFWTISFLTNPSSLFVQFHLLNFGLARGWFTTRICTQPLGNTKTPLSNILQKTGIKVPHTFHITSVPSHFRWIFTWGLFWQLLPLTCCQFFCVPSFREFAPMSDFFLS